MSRVQISEFTKSVLEAIKKIPEGKVATYKQIAELAGKPQGARGVAWILHSCSTRYKLPWHRVLNSGGSISFEKKTRNFKDQKRKLEREGVILNVDGELDLKRFQWKKKPAKKRAVRGSPRMFAEPSPAKIVKKKAPPFEFVLEEIASSRVGKDMRTNPMFGCLAIYIGEKIVLILRSKRDGATDRDDGIWVVIAEGEIDSIREDFPSLRPIEMFRDMKKNEKTPSWWNLPETSEDFEARALAICDLVIKRDPRLGKVPKGKKKAKR